MQPHTAMIWSGFAALVCVSAPTLPRTRCSACSRTAQVFRITKSAFALSSVKPKPISARYPRSFSLSASFCWQPKVSTIASGRMPRERYVSRTRAQTSSWRAISSGAISVLL